MTTRHLVDPELVAILDMFPALTFTPESLVFIRAALKEMHTQAPGDLPDFSAISVNEYFVPGLARRSHRRLHVTSWMR